MSNPIIEAIPLRIQLAPVSNPPVAPIDRNTGEQPRIFQGQTAAFQIGIFNSSNVAIDLSNLAYLQVVLKASQNAPVALVSKQIDAADITDTITIADWIAGIAEQATALFTAADTDQGLQGETELEFWLQITGFTDDGAPLIYGAGAITIVASSASLPIPQPGVTSRHAQSTVADDVTVTPTSPIHTEIVTVTGVARDSKILLGIQNILDGNRVVLIVELPATLGINFTVYSNIGTNPVIFEFTTGNVLKGRVEFYYNADDATWVLDLVNFPPS